LSSDNRLYTDIIIEGTTFKALLDSGATVTCLGGAAAKTLAHHQKTRKCSGKIRTASNESCSVIILGLKSPQQAVVELSDTNQINNMSEPTQNQRINFGK